MKPMEIEAYVTRGCSYCDHLKELLQRAGLFEQTKFYKVDSFGTVDGKHLTREQFLEKFPDANGYPYVIIDGVEYGGLVPTARFLVQKGLVSTKNGDK
jgi:glutaredoxin|tara:strand:+ start:745 stop:1038 length:294 start_codon:yes stop_codon:yes gene_type:complete